MPIPTPNLDDRTWAELVEEARRFAAQSFPDWTDRSPSDPGMVLVEVFAYLTEMVIYRLNRLPEKAYVEFLRLMGVTLQPPTAAMVRLEFTRQRTGAGVTIPAGTAVTVSRQIGSGELPVFRTLEELEIAPDASAGNVLAIHGEVQIELLGQGTGRAGQTFTVGRAPIVASVEEDTRGLVVAVEVSPDEQVPPADLVDLGLGSERQRYRRWQEVENFTHTGQNDLVFIVDRAEGRITFAPALQVRDETGDLAAEPTSLGAVPPAGRDVIVAYRTGGGQAGNVAEGSLTVLKAPIGELQVTNPLPARGGRGIESLENALKRGPLELRSPQRAVTARDYEQIALLSGAVNRARAFTKSEIWNHALPGMVEVLLVPALSTDHPEGAPVPIELLRRLQEDTAPLELVADALESRRSIGTQCDVRWARYKPVQVKARVVIHRETDRQGIEERVVRRLHRAINPLQLSADASAAQFGRTLHVSNVYDICLSEPGVTFVDRVALFVDQAPEKSVSALAPDGHQPSTWYAGSHNQLFRSGNDGLGWELIQEFPLPGETVEGEVEIREVVCHPAVPGRVAVVAQVKGDEFRVYTSPDCGQTWRNLWNPGSQVRGATWTSQGATCGLLMATDQGLYRVLDDTANPDPRLISIQGKSDTPLLAIAASAGPDGTSWVAVAAAKASRIEGGGGVFLSRQAGAADTFEEVKEGRGLDIATLAFQRLGNVSWLWAGTRAVGNAPGDGCLRWELGAEIMTKNVQKLGRANGWDSGSCYALTTTGRMVWAATLRGGVVRMDTRERELAWVKSERDAGLPLDPDSGHLAPVEAIGCGEMVNPSEGPQPVVLASGDQGIFHSLDAGGSFRGCSQREFREKVTLPPTWLVCSGDHQIQVIHEDELNEQPWPW